MNNLNQIAPPVLTSHQEQEVALALCVVLNANVLLWGPPGAGKTSVLKSIAQKWGFHLETILVSTKEASEISGIPYIYEGNERIGAPEYVKNVLSNFANKKISLCMWDEFSTGMPSVQAASLTTILDRKAGPHQMPLETRMVAAANPPKIAANGWDLSAPTANRFVHLDWTLDANSIAEGLQLGWKAPLLPQMPKNPALLRSAIRKTEILLGAFIRSQPSIVDFDYSTYRKNASKNTYRASDNAFPTARSLTVAATLYAGAKVARMPNGGPIPDNVLTILLEGCIGTGAANEFLRYARNLDLPDPKEVLNNPASTKIPARNDQMTALLASVHHEAIAQMSINPPVIWSRWGDVLSMVLDQGKGDIALPFVKEWQRRMPPGAAPTPQQQKSIDNLTTVFA